MYACKYVQGVLCVYGKCVCACVYVKNVVCMYVHLFICMPKNISSIVHVHVLRVCMFSYITCVDVCMLCVRGLYSNCIHAHTNTHHTYALHVHTIKIGATTDFLTHAHMHESVHASCLRQEQTDRRLHEFASKRLRSQKKHFLSKALPRLRPLSGT